MSPQTTAPISDGYVTLVMHSLILSCLITFQKRLKAAHNDAKNTWRWRGQKGKQEEGIGWDHNSQLEPTVNMYDTLGVGSAPHRDPHLNLTAQ